MTLYLRSSTIKHILFGVQNVCNYRPLLKMSSSGRLVKLEVDFHAIYQVKNVFIHAP